MSEMLLHSISWEETLFKADPAIPKHICPTVEYDGHYLLKVMENNVLRPTYNDPGINLLDQDEMLRQGLL